jgi:hypothetical protein
MVIFLMIALIMVLLSAAWKGDDPQEAIASTTPTLPHGASLPIEDPVPDLTPLVYRSVEDEEPLIQEPSGQALSTQSTIAPAEYKPQPVMTAAPPVEITPLVEDSSAREVTVIVQQSRSSQPADSPAPPPPPANSAAVQQFIDALDIRGVMSSGQRLLIHNETSGRTQAFQAGSVIDEKLNLSILKVEDRLITFSTDDGQIYTKRF